MGSAIALRDDFDGKDLRRLARATKDAGQSRRLLALAEIYDGGRRRDAARVGGVGLQVIRDTHFVRSIQRIVYQSPGHSTAASSHSLVDKLSRERKPILS